MATPKIIVSQHEISIKTKDDNHISKAASVIQMRTTLGSLGLLQRKLINALMYFAKSDPDKETHYVHRRDIEYFLQFNSHNTKYLKDLANELTSVKVEWDFMRIDKERVWGTGNLLSQIEFISDGLVTYSFPPRLREIMSTAEIRGMINMEVSKQFDSGFSLALYEYLTLYKEALETPMISLPNLKLQLGIDEEKNPTYKEFKHFNQKVINVAVKEINQVSEFLVVPHTHRTGRSITAMSFTFALKPQSFLDFGQGVLNTYEIKDKLVDFGFSEKVALDIVGKHEAEYVLSILDYVVDLILKDTEKKIKSPTGFFIKALEKDYRTKEPKIVTEARVKRQNEQFQRAQKVESDREILKSESAVIRAELDDIKARYMKLTDDEQVALRVEFLEICKEKNPYIAKTFKSKGIDSKISAYPFFEFLKNKWGDVASTIPS